jgi:hypothetical protein
MVKRARPGPLLLDGLLLFQTLNDINTPHDLAAGRYDAAKPNDLGFPRYSRSRRKFCAFAAFWQDTDAYNRAVLKAPLQLALNRDKTIQPANSTSVIDEASAVLRRFTRAFLLLTFWSGQ